MTEQPKTPEFYGETPMGQGQKVPHEAGIEARLKAAGVGPAMTLDEFQRQKAEKADMVAQHTIQGFAAKIEPTTEKSIVGYSPEKKEALKLMHSEGITIGEAMEKVKSEKAEAASSKKKATRKTGKGE